MKLLLRSIVFVAVTCIAPLTYGQATSWTNTGPDNNFDNGQNWTTAVSVGIVPGPGNLVGIFPGFTTSPDTQGVGFIPVVQGGNSTITINATHSESIEGLLVSSNFDTNTVANGIFNLSLSSGTLAIGDEGIALIGGTTMNFTGGIQLTDGAIVTVGSNNNQIDPSQTTGSGTLVLNAGNVNLDGATTSFVIGDGATITGSVTQNTGSVVTSAQTLTIGTNGGTGTYTMNGNSILNIGTQGTPLATSYVVTIGGATGATGSLIISGTSTLNAINPNTQITIASSVGSTGTVTQSGTTTVSLGGNSLTIGDNGTGTYNLQGGSLTISSLDATLGLNPGSSGTLNQTGGSLVVKPGTGFDISDGGTGTYMFSSGTADFQSGFIVGDGGGTGTVTQTGGTLTTENNLSELGATGGTGTYNLEAGSATFSGGLSINGTSTLNVSGGTFSLGTTTGVSLAVSSGGIVNQTGGTVTIDATLGQTLDLSIFGSTYDLNGGTLQIGDTATTKGLALPGADGTLNFGGGTLQITSSDAGTFTDPLQGTITGTSTIDTTVSDVKFTGNLNGSGTLDLIGGHTVTFSGTNNVADSWGATLTGGGTMTAGSITNLSTTGSYVIGTGSTFNLGSTAATSDTFLGNISSTDDLAGNANFNTGTNKLILAGQTNLGAASVTTLGAGGSLEVDQGTISNVNGATGNAADTFDVGSGTSTGVVTLLGTNVLPQVTVNAGSTLFAQNITGSVTNSGSLGTLGTFASPSNLAISNTLTSTNTLLINVNGSAADSFTATSATLSGLVKVTGIGSNTYNIVVTTGGVTIGGNGMLNDAGGLNTNPPTPLFRATLQLVGDDLQLTTVQSTVTSFAQTRNQAAVAGAIDSVIQRGIPFSSSFQPLLGALNGLTAAQIPGALDQLSPEVLQYARPIAYENATFLAQRMNGVDANLRAGYYGIDTSGLSMVNPGFDSGLGRSLGSMLAYNSPPFHDSAPNGVNYYPGAEGDSSSPVTPQPTWDSATQTISDSPSSQMTANSPSSPNSSLKMPAFSEFISGDIILADLNKDQSANNAAPNKASYTSGNATAGVSFRMTSNLSAGVLFDYNHTDAKTDNNGSKTKVDTYSPGLYATYADHGFYANGLFAFGYSQYSNTRNVSLLGETATSSPNGTQYVGNLDAGYDFHPFHDWVVGPSVGLTYTHVNIDSIQETGAPGANLSINSQDNGDDLRSEFGGHVMYAAQAGPILLVPNLSVLWQHEYLNLDGNSMTSHFSDFGSASFSTATAAPSKDSALIGLGVTATLSNSMSLYLNYIADAGASDYFAQSVVGGFKARF